MEMMIHCDVSMMIEENSVVDMNRHNAKMYLFDECAPLLVASHSAVSPAPCMYGGAGCAHISRIQVWLREHEQLSYSQTVPTPLPRSQPTVLLYSCDPCDTSAKSGLCFETVLFGFKNRRKVYGLYPTTIIADIIRTSPHGC